MFIDVLYFIFFQTAATHYNNTVRGYVYQWQFTNDKIKCLQLDGYKNYIQGTWWYQMHGVIEHIMYYMYLLALAVNK